MRDFQRRLLYCALPVVIVAVLLLCGQWLLSSHRLARALAEKLEAMLNLPVRVGEARIGLRTPDSNVSEIQVFEANDRALAQPWVQIKEAAANIGMLELLGGAMPGSVDLHGFTVELRFDAQGHLLTLLPAAQGKQPLGEIPRCRVLDGRVTLAQEGRRPMVVNGIVADLQAVHGAVRLEGKIDDPYWGKWKATADYQPGGVCKLRLTADKMPVDQAKLEALPFIPPSVWRQVKVEGVTPVDFEMNFSAEGGKTEVHYTVVLEPENTRVHVASIGLDAERAKGKVVVTDKLVELRNVTGQSADGEIHTDADLDFRADTSSMRFLIAARDLVLRKLPATWSLPLFDGSLSGKADLRLTVRDGHVRTGGGGEGTISNPRLAGLGKKLFQERPIRLELRADGERFRLDAQRSALKTLLPALVPF